MATRTETPAQLERDLAAAARRSAATRRRADEADAQRDELIREARAAGISQRRVMEITGLSRSRLNQIVRESRL